MSKLILLSLLTSLFASFTAVNPALAFPLPKKGAEHALRIPSTFTANYNFVGIVALDNCSGSLVRFEASKDTDPALIITNGHCVESGFTPAGQFLYHKPSSRTFDLLDAESKSVSSVSATEIVYSTMTKTDITIYKLDTTYADIKSKYAIDPLTLSSQHPAEQAPIEIISGYWQRGYSCSIEKFIPAMKEDQWSWVDSLRYSRPGCETIGGTSGSPVILAGTRTMIAINNTGNESGESCTLNNPCEVDSRGQVTVNKGDSYAQETYWIYSCLNPNNEFDLSVAGCALPH